MRRSIWIPATILVTAITAGAAAQTPDAPAPAAPSAPAAATRPESAVPTSVGPAKIAVIAFQVAVTQTNEFQRSFGEVQKKFQPKRTALKTMGDQIESLTKELQATDSKLTDQEKATKARELDDKKKQYDREQQDDQTDFTQSLQDIFQQTASKVYDVLSNYAQQHGYTLVLDVAATQQNPVMFVGAPTMDITKEITTAYNVKSGVPPPATTSTVPTVPAPKAPAAKPATKPPSQ